MTIKYFFLMANPFETSVDDSYNPFAMGSNYSQDQNNAPASSNSNNNPPPNNSYTSDYSAAPASQQNDNSYKDSVTGIKLTDAELTAREEALRKKEEKIAAREKQIEEARANGTLSSLNPFPKNFPILLKFYKYYPDDDLTEDCRPLMKKMYWLSYGAGLVLGLNALMSLFCLAPGVSAKLTSVATSLVFSWFFFIVLYPVLLETCIMPLYNSMKDFKGIKFFGYLCMSFLFLAFFVYIAVGLGDYGSFGFMIAIDILGAEKNTWVGVICLIFAIIATIFVVAWGWMWWVSVVFFRKTDFKSAALREAAGYAADYAKDHKEDIAKAAVEHPDVVVAGAQYAAANAN